MDRGELRDELERAETPWSAVLALLGYWETRPTGHRIAHDLYGDHHAPWASLESEVSLYFHERASRSLQLTDDDRSKIDAWLGPDADFDCAHAIAWGIDDATHKTFPMAWLEGLDLDDNGCYSLRVGEAYPIGELDEDDVDGIDIVPHAATDPRKNELPHVRFFEPPTCKWVTEVVLDFRLGGRLEPLFSTLTELATIHPNERFDEWAHSEGSSLFPVLLKKPDDQPARIERLLARVRDTDFKAQIIVAPELAATSESVDRVQRALDDGDAYHLMVVAGSIHLLDGDRPVNRAYALMPDGEPICHDKIVPVRRRPRLGRSEQTEGIHVNSTLRIYQAGRFRFALLICKDFLDDHLQELLGRLGVNVIVVPAMSPKTGGFVTAARRLSERSQAIVVVANGPYRWGGRVARPAAVFGQPVERYVAAQSQPSGDCCTGCSWFALGSRRAAATWLSVQTRTDV